MVYLLHFDSQIAHAQHYIGWFDNPARLQQHADGTSRAHLPAEFHRRGIAFQLVRTWEGDRHLERRLKQQKNARRLCPVCRGKALLVHAALERDRKRRKREAATCNA